MYQYEYYKEKDGKQPLRGWIADLPIKERAIIRAKIEKLEQEGLKLLNTNMMSTIKDYCGDFYELIGGSLRIGIYFDRPKNIFILLHGWRKKKQKQPRDIEEAFSRLKDYLLQERGQK